MVAIDTFDLFEYEKEIDSLAVEYHNELQNLLGIRTLEMRYAGDLQGEKQMNGIERSVDRIQKKFVYTRIDDRKEYSQFKIDSRQKWTKEGYQKALEDKMVYFLTVATCTASMRFYGREEALKRLQEQNIV